MRLADMITANPSVMLMLPRFGIRTGFGNAKVDDVCRQNHVPTDFFLLVCNVYSFDDYIPSADAIAGTDMTCLIDYLCASHAFYTDSRLPHIESHLNHLAVKAGKYGQALLMFYADYKHEMAEHFAYEESVVYPHLQSLQNDATVKHSYHIATYARRHGNVEDKLNDLIQLIFKDMPATCMEDETMEMIFDILQFSADLNKHALIEEKILIPYVEMLEQQHRKA